MKLADINKLDKILKEFGNGSDRTNNDRVTNFNLVVKTGHYRLCGQRSFFLTFCWIFMKLVVAITRIKYEMSLKMGQIGSTLAELCLYRPRFQLNQLQTFSE